MIRSGFKSRTPYVPRQARQWTADELPGPRTPLQVVPLAPRAIVSIPKDNPVRDEAYRRLVAALPCINCHVVGFSQAAHGPTLGAGIKSDDTDCFPLCCARSLIPGCHFWFDQYILFPAEQRAAVAIEWARRTREQLAMETA
ncbi:MAG TPA: hypothetical protein VNU71_13430 [Burkholderiaceae bacterium]|nr:hypothetical protein [Burkholderiaceae bacterium]